MSGYACKDCEDSGWLDAPDGNAVVACHCRAQLVASRRSRSLSGVIPARYRGVSFDRPPVNTMPSAQVDLVKGYVRQLETRIGEGRGLWFFGDVGTGKTTLAMLVSQTAIEQRRSVAIYSLPRLLAEIRSTFEDDNEGGYTELLDRLAEIDLLQIDDLGAEKTSAWVLEQLYSIVNARYEGQRSIIVTTNLERDELAAQIGERTVSRLEEMCELCPLFGADQRRFEAVDMRDKDRPPSPDLRIA